MNSGSVAFIQRDDGLILCVWNKRYSGWTLPGGRHEPGEDPAQTCIRETREETGLSVVIQEHVTTYPTSGSDGEVNLYVARSVAGVACEREQGCAVTWFKPEEVRRWLCFRNTLNALEKAGLI